MAPSRWDLDSEYKLMLAAVVHLDAKLPPKFFEEFVDKLDKDITASAANQRFYKLKREAEDILNKPGTSDDGTAAADPSTPAGKTTTVGAKKSTAKGKKRKQDGDDNDETAEASPTKSAKAKKTKTAKTAEAADASSAADAGAADEA